MFVNSSAYYDRLYRSIKNFQEEAQRVATIINNNNRKAKTILDVACGTGEHASFLAGNHGYLVDGIDLDPNLLEIAAAKVPSGEFSVANMTDFAIGKTYDVITCLFSSIGYVKTIDNLTKTFTCFKSHLTEDGIVVVEPWYTPDNWSAGRVFLKTFEDDEVKIARIVHSRIERNMSFLEMEYIIGTAKGISRISETHELGLFTTEETIACFEQAGFSVTYESDGLCGRGLYVARG